MSTPQVSYLTGLPARASGDGATNTLYFDDPVCGSYGIGSLTKMGLDQKIWEKRRIASVLAERKIRGFKQNVLLVEKRTDGDSAVAGVWTPIVIDELLALWPSSAVEMLQESLLNFSYRLNHPSDMVRIAPEDCWLAYAHDAASLKYVTDQLCDLGYMSDQKADPATSYRTHLYSIQAKGWELISALRKSADSARKQAFAAMWFDSEMESVFQEGIMPAVQHDGTKCVRVDMKEHNNKICDEIVSEIRRSKYVVADFTGNRGGVYFEAGFAYGLGIPVIWTVRADFIDKVHFDTRQYNHIVYNSPKELHQRLISRIKATIL